MYYSQEQIVQLNESFKKLKDVYIQICVDFVSIKYNDERANEHFQHGLGRRFHTLYHCINRVFEIYPPDRTAVLNDEEHFDVEIFIQAFIINLYGIVDNLAWIVNFEKNLGLKNTKVNLYDSQINKFFTEKFNSYLNNEDIHGFKEWYNKHCANFRHAIGHRIPLYVPPFGISKTNQYQKIYDQRIKSIIKRDYNKAILLEEEEDALKHIVPLYLHSYGEKSPQVYIHPQLIADFNTIVELWENFLKGFNP